MYMNKIIKVEDSSYELINNYRDGFDESEFLNRYTDYFKEFDYIVGDWAYSKLRLKGFYEDNNKKSSKINRISILEKYIEDNCAYGCRYFVLKKQ